MPIKAGFAHTLAIFILIVISFTLYSNCLNNEFVWDDEFLIVNNKLIKDFHNIKKIFSTDIFAGSGSKSNFYRPLQTVSYLFDYSWGKLNPQAYHLTNIIVHLINAILIYFVIFVIIGNKRISLLTGMLFVIHPVHTEAVTYISGRADPLGVVFGLSAILLFLKFRFSDRRLSRNIYYSLSLLSFALALLSKEAMIVLPFLIIICDWAVNSEKKRGFSRYYGFFVLLFIYGALRFTILSFPAEKVIPVKLAVYPRLLKVGYVIVEYFKIILFPFNLHMERKIIAPVSFFEPRVLFSAAVLLAGLVFTWRSLNKSKLVLFGAAWFFIALIPVSNIVPINAAMAEHWLYLPSIGIFFIMAIYLNILIQSRMPGVISFGVIILIVAYFSVLTIRQNTVWKNGLTLYPYTLKLSPNSGRVHYNLANIFAESGKSDEAVREYNIAIALRPGFANAYNNLGRIYLKKDEFKRAAEFFEQSLKISPSDPEILVNLAEALRNLEEYDQALELYEESLAIEPVQTSVYVNLASIYLIKNDYSKAIEVCEKALKLNSTPDIKAKIYYNLGLAYLQIGKINMAKDVWEQALKLDPSLTQPAVNLEKLKGSGY